MANIIPAYSEISKPTEFNVSFTVPLVLIFEHGSNLQIGSDEGCKCSRCENTSSLLRVKFTAAKVREGKEEPDSMERVICGICMLDVFARMMPVVDLVEEDEKL